MNIMPLLLSPVDPLSQHQGALLCPKYGFLMHIVEKEAHRGIKRGLYHVIMHLREQWDHLRK